MCKNILYFQVSQYACILIIRPRRIFFIADCLATCLQFLSLYKSGIKKVDFLSLNELL